MARGGAERFLIDLLNNLDKSIFEPSVILFKDKGPYYSELIEQKINVYSLSKKSKLGLINFYRILTLLKKISPQIVHTQLGGDIRGRLAAYFNGIKIIISTEQNINNSEKWYQRLAKSITSLTSTTIIAISQAVADDMRKRYHLPAEKCNLIIPNGIDLTKFKYQEKITDASNKNIGAIGRLHQQKGFDLLINAWDIIKPKSAHLLIAGEGLEREKLEHQINQANLKQEINLIGDVQHVNFFYENLDLLIIPSRWEGLGIVALEAGAKGVPILASDADGLKEVLNNENAWIFKACDQDSLVEQLKLALSQLASKETVVKQKKLRQYIEEKFDIIKITQQYSDLYLKLWQKKYENSASK